MCVARLGVRVCVVRMCVWVDVCVEVGQVAVAWDTVRMCACIVLCQCERPTERRHIYCRSVQALLGNDGRVKAMNKVPAHMHSCRGSSSGNGGKG